MPKLDHVAIFVDDLDAGISFYSDLLGLGAPIVKSVPELNIRCAFFDAGDTPMIELVSFTGAGELAHGDAVVAIEVDDLDVATADYRAKGMKVHEQPATANLPLRRGWITKANGHGTIIELCAKGEFARFVHSAIGSA
jgi:methylmalonyl-CoA/ethylmalonyl-CoA epimerase